MFHNLKLTAAERLIPQKKVTGDQDAIRRAAKRARKARLAKKALKKSRGPVLVPAVADRMSTPLAAAPAKPKTFVVVVLHPKEEALRFEDSPYYYGYRRRTCSGESCNGTRNC